MTMTYSDLKDKYGVYYEIESYWDSKRKLWVATCDKFPGLESVELGQMDSYKALAGMMRKIIATGVSVSKFKSDNDILLKKMISML